ncbi:hypothetical protein [Flavobacterium psychrotrophum]|uniref:hypothetical protein n=1 Tax=Flavobacterium psychrotrophum TaxID=2294119 RepID=UPI000E30D82F|nr:hypothetical protein [Flavobacterium psychrotrophum]
MQKKLTATDIEQIYAFTAENGVAYYDLQSELADHLAHAIEEQWAYNQNLSLEDDLHAAFKTFGTGGFNEVVMQRKRALGKRYQKLLLGYFKDFFTLPKLVLTVALLYGLHLILLQSHDVIVFSILPIQFISVVKMLRLKNKLAKTQENTGRKWLFEEMIYKGVFTVATLGFFPGLSQLSAGRPMGGIYGHWILVTLITLLALHNYIALFIIPARAKEHLKTVYPEYGL